MSQKRNVLGGIKGRGHSDLTKIAINEIYYVGIAHVREGVREGEECFIFDKKDIRQTEAGISIHISVNEKKSKECIGKFLGYYKLKRPNVK